MIKIRVLLVDDHDLFRRGLAEVLAEEPDVEVVGQARDGQEAMEKAMETRPDVVFMDLNLPGQSGIETTAYITQKWPDMKVLVLTVSEEAGDLFRALGVGALGYVLKNASPREIVDAMRVVHQGSVLVSPHMAPRFITDLSPPSGPSATHVSVGDARVMENHLTLREQQILRRVSQGMSNSEIADTLLVSENTVKTHIKNILSKLHTKNRSEAVALASRLGFLKPEEEGNSS